MDCNNISLILKYLLDKRKHPILLHCLEGDYGTSCVIGCLRKFQNWSLTSIFNEYNQYCKKENSLDLQFIYLFIPTLKFNKKYLPDWIDHLENPIRNYLIEDEDEDE